MSFKIAVIGAGWYGCHIGLSLSALGFDIKIFERERRPLHRASGNNQFRLHLGFHYARHHGTRQQSRDGFLRFIERYPNLSSPVDRNIYAVPKSDSLIDFTTYKMIMAASGIEFTETTEYEHFLSNVSGAILTKERVLMINQARDYFQESLTGILHLETAVTSMEPLEKHVRVNGELFDYVIDATWGHFLSIPRELYFEPTMLLYYEAMDHHPAVTLVDGSLCSVYPTEDPSIFTLSSVAHTPLGGFTNANQARACINSVDSVLIREKQTAMENQMMRYLPQFCESFQFKGVQLAIKTKPVGMEDDRSCAIYRNDRIFSVLSGKIDTIFYATERILSSLEGSQLFSTPRNVSIRNDIVAASSRQAGARIASSNKKNLAQDA